MSRGCELCNSSEFLTKGNLLTGIMQLRPQSASVPGRRRLEKLMTSRDAIKRRLKESDYHCMTADLWTRHWHSFLGVTVHYMDESFMWCSFVIACKEMTERHTHEVLARMLAEVRLCTCESTWSYLAHE